VFDLIICNNRDSFILPKGTEMVMLDEELSSTHSVYSADLVDEENPWRHDPRKLAQAVMDIYYEKTGPLSLRDN
jgi:hypothetical protein